MKVADAQELAVRFMKRTGKLVDWIEIRRASQTDNIIVKDGIGYKAIIKIKL